MLGCGSGEGDIEVKRKRQRSWKTDYSLLITGQMVSVFGSSLHLVVVILFLKELTGQAYALGIFQFVAYLPVILLSPLGGAAADGRHAKQILVGADILRGLAMVAMGVLLLRGMLTYGVLLAGTFIVSLGTAFFQPAVHALFPRLVEPAFIKRGNGIRGAALLGSNFAGTSLGGIAFAFLGPTAVFFFNGCSFIVSAAEEGFIRNPGKGGDEMRFAESPDEEAAGRKRMLADLRRRTAELIGYVRVDRGALSAVLTYGMVHAVYPPVVLVLPFYIEEVLGLGAEEYGYAMALLLLGGGLGAVGYGFLASKERGNARLLFLSLLLLSLLLAAAGIFPETPVLFSSLAPAGACLGVVHQIMTTTLYRRVPPDSRGRVFGLMESLASAAMPISYAVSGFAVELFRNALPSFVLLVAGLSLSMTAAVYLHGRLADFVTGSGTEPGTW